MLLHKKFTWPDFGVVYIYTDIPPSPVRTPLLSDEGRSSANCNTGRNLLRPEGSTVTVGEQCCADSVLAGTIDKVGCDDTRLLVVRRTPSVRAIVFDIYFFSGVTHDKQSSAIVHVSLIYNKLLDPETGLQALRTLFFLWLLLLMLLL